MIPMRNVRFVFYVAIFTLILFKQLPVAQSHGLRILDLLLRNQADTQCASIYVHGSKELEQFETLNENYEGFPRANQQNSILSSLCIKYVVLTSSYINQTQILRDVFRYAEASSVVLLPAKIGYVQAYNKEYIKDVVYGVFESSFYLSVHCIFLIVDNGDVFQWEKYSTQLHVQKQPANMMLVKFMMRNSESGKQVELYVRYMCFGYCPEQWTRFTYHLLPSLSLHKKHTHNANSRLISYGLRPTGQTSDSNLFAFCSKSVPIRCGSGCSANVMIPLTLSNIHNLTVKIFNQRVASEEKAFQDDHEPYLTEPYSRLDEISDTEMYEMIYATDAFLIVYYCSKTNRWSVDESKLFHWIVPFTVSLWLYCFTLLAVPVLATLFLRKSVSESMAVFFGILGVVLKQYTNVVGKQLLVFTSVFALIVCSFYESQITSLAIVQLPPSKIQSFHELITKGYKILLYEELPVELFESEFKRRNMLDVFNQSFFRFASLYDDFDETIDLKTKLLATSDGNVSYALYEQNVHIHFNLWYSTELTRKETGSPDYDCHSLPDVLLPTQDFWRTNLKNRYWLQRSILSLDAAGLYQIWETWPDWVIKFQYINEERELQHQGKWLGESLFHKKIMGPALIRIEEIFGFLFLTSCLVIASFLLLFLEYYAKHRADNLTDNRVIIIRPTNT
ncbi:unnamed protein product [Orchesella dallaii]|uniref:Uncharacterized protein n=1 Tax=Orchesella dallaii TaxID=48710 RepID=A0ABP1RLL5_9HEXA